MRAYKIDDTHWAMFAGTLAEAHNRAKVRHPEQGQPFNLTDVQIQEVEIPTDKAGILALLNNDPATLGFKALRTWELTDRGGLREITTQEAP